MHGGELFSSVLTGVELAARFNPLASLAGSVIGAVVAIRSERLRGALLVAGGAWLVGDGARIVLLAAGLAEEASAHAAAGASAQTAIALGVWAAGGLLLGYVTPLWAGTYVGSRVTHGTGWLAAGAVAATASAALATLASRLPF